MSCANSEQRRRRVQQLVLHLPQVTGVGFGWKETRGQITNIPAWRVYVRRKLPHQALEAADIAPAQLEGLATDVLPAQDGVALVSVNAMAAPITPGVTISNLRGLHYDKPVDRNTSGLGTLGFFALANGRRERQVMLISNRHVLLAHGAHCGEPIYSPVFSQRGDVSVIRRDALEPVAEIADEGLEANHPFRYPGEAVAEYFVDCASARMLRQQKLFAGLRVSNGEPPKTIAVRGIARMHPLDAVGGRAPRVRKIGGVTGLTFGRVVDVAAPVECAGGPQRLQNLVIRGADGPFVEPGDSGALLLNDRDQAIGLVWGRCDSDANIAYACHIHPVLDRLRVTMMAGGLV